MTADIQIDAEGNPMKLADVDGVRELVEAIKYFDQQIDFHRAWKEELQVKFAQRFPNYPFPATREDSLRFLENWREELRKKFVFLNGTCNVLDQVLELFAPNTWGDEEE